MVKVTAMFHESDPINSLIKRSLALQTPSFD